MKAVMQSVSPRICEKVATGDCTVLVSKTAPKCDVPFKDYIYCIKSGEIIYGNSNIFVTDSLKRLRKSPAMEDAFEKQSVLTRWNGKVIGEFVCNRIDGIQKRGFDNNFDYCYLSLNEWGNDDIEIEITDIKKSRIPKADLNKYGANVQWLYAWHISDLKIYDKPKELREFRKPLDSVRCSYFKGQDYCEENCVGFGNTDYFCKEYWDWERGLTRAPKSWQYVEEL